MDCHVSVKNDTRRNGKFLAPFPFFFLPIFRFCDIMGTILTKGGDKDGRYLEEESKRVRTGG